MTEKIGFIGMGIMGRPMALNLLKAGYAVAVSSRRRESCLPLEVAGAAVCDTPRAVAERSDIIFICVPDTPDVERVIMGGDGIVHAAKAGSVVVDMSTISPEATRELAAALFEKGVHMLDAPVSGGEAGAVSGALSIMVGGKSEIVARVKPCFEKMGKNIVHIGDHGAGQVAKSCNQVIVGVTIEAVSEALLLAEKSGVDGRRVREALMGGFAGSKILEVHGQRMLDGDFRPGFKAKLHRKDMGIALEAAGKLGVGLPAAALMTAHLDGVIRGGDGELDSSVIFRLLRKLSSSPARPAK